MQAVRPRRGGDRMRHGTAAEARSHHAEAQSAREGQGGWYPNETHLRPHHRPGPAGGPDVGHDHGHFGSGKRRPDNQTDGLPAGNGHRHRAWSCSARSAVFVGRRRCQRPHSRYRFGYQHCRIRRLGPDAIRLRRRRNQAAAFFRADVPARQQGSAAAGTQGRPDLLRSRRHAKCRDVPRERPDAGGGRRRPGFAGPQQRYGSLPGSGSRYPDGASSAGASAASARAASTRPASTGPASTGPASTGPASTGPASTVAAGSVAAGSVAAGAGPASAIAASTLAAGANAAAAPDQYVSVASPGLLQPPPEHPPPAPLPSTYARWAGGGLGRLAVNMVSLSTLLPSATLPEPVAA